MGFISFDNLRKLWSVWQLRGIILFSLFLQIFLVFLSPLRKKTANAKIIGLIWLAYLVADWAASFAVGIISQSQGDTSISQRRSDLMAFWAPFLLNHLGGPDTITAFALEDNELYPRHLLQLLAQLAATGYVFYKSLPSNELSVPTILMFIAGLIKYGERTNSLYHASVDKFQNSLIKPRDPGPAYSKIVEEYWIRKDARMPVSIDLTTEPELELTFKSQYDTNKFQDAFMFFNIFKGQVADVVFRKHEGKKSRDYFLRQEAKEAFEVVELELNFIYDILYTKMVVIHDWLGYFFRLISFVLVFVSFWLWYSMDKSLFDRHDVKITYTLLFGAITLDIVAFFMLIFSDWTIAHVKPIRVARKHLEEKIPSSLLAFGFFRRRWSETIRQYNFIRCCLNARGQLFENLSERWGLKYFLDGIKYEFLSPYTESLRDLIFSELKEKAEAMDKPEEAEKIFKARGDWALERISRDSSREFSWDNWINKVEYDESLLIWHIATDLCHDDERQKSDNCRMSKTLSDYMLYLLIRQPKMMTTVAGIGQLRFRDTSAEAERFFDSLDLNPKWKEEKRRNNACKELLAVDARIPTKEAKGERSKSVLFEGCRLAKELNKLDDDKWRVISKVWVEMLSYAASRCSGNAHAAQLCKGGQLITFVWLLMVHLGLKKQFLIQNDVGAKLVIGRYETA